MCPETSLSSLLKCQYDRRYAAAFSDCSSIVCCSFSHSVGSSFSATQWTVAPQTPLSTEFPRKNTGVGCHFLLQGIFPNQGSNMHLLYWQQDSLPLSHLGSPIAVLLLTTTYTLIVFSRKLSTSLIPLFKVSLSRVHQLTHTSLPDLTINFCYSNHSPGRRFRVESWLSYLQKFIVKLFSLSKAQFSYQTIHFSRFYAS